MSRVVVSVSCLSLCVCAGRKNSFFSFLVGVRAAAQRRPCLPLFKRPRLPCGGEHGPVFRATARRMYATADLCAVLFVVVRFMFEAVCHRWCENNKSKIHTPGLEVGGKGGGAGSVKRVRRMCHAALLVMPSIIWGRRGARAFASTRARPTRPLRGGRERTGRRARRWCWSAGRRWPLLQGRGGMLPNHNAPSFWTPTRAAMLLLQYALFLALPASCAVQAAQVRRRHAKPGAVSSGW